MRIRNAAGRDFYYVFILERQKIGDIKDCWMTAGVRTFMDAPIFQKESPEGVNSAQRYRPSPWAGAGLNCSAGYVRVQIMNASEYNGRLKTTGRNDACPCGSGKKYKKCHLAEDEAAKHAELVKAAEERQAALNSENAADAGETSEDAAKDAEGKGESAVSQSKTRRERLKQTGKSSSGRGRSANIPRRGAV